MPKAHKTKATYKKKGTLQISSSAGYMIQALKVQSTSNSNQWVQIDICVDEIAMHFPQHTHTHTHTHTYPPLLLFPSLYIQAGKNFLKTTGMKVENWL
jgi:hypothetical protein